MDLVACHGFDHDELATYYKIAANDKMSVAYYTASGRKMQPFVHAHKAYEFILPLDTIPILRYQEANYIGEVGYCYPVNPEVKHGLGFELSSELFSIVVDPRYVEAIKAQMGLSGRWFYTRFAEGSKLVALLHRFVMSPLPSLTDEIVRLLVGDGLAATVDNRRPDAQYFVGIKDSIAYMMDHYLDHDLTIKEVAAHSAFGYTYFTKAFCRYMHDTPINHLNKLRLSKAKQLMRTQPQLTLSQIALASGYKSGSAFCEAFKRVLGVSPKDYRKFFV